MADGGIRPEILEDFETVARLREARKFPGLVPAQRFTAEKLVEALEGVSAAVMDGLSLRSAAALVGVSHRVTALWIRQADDGAEPYASWLATLLRDDAIARRQTLVALRELSTCDTSALREVARQAGMPSALERELDLLRRSRTAPADAFFAPVDHVHQTRDHGPAKPSHPTEGVER